MTLLVEKQQVQLLSASVVEILSRVGKETGQGPPEEAMGLEEPIVPEWRAGRLSIGYQEDRDLLLLEAEELVPDTEEDEETEDDGPDEDLLELEPQLRAASTAPDGEDAGGEDAEGEDEELEDAPEKRAAGEVRLWATREQMLSLARHGAAVCAQGRPRCPLCGNALDPEGHICPLLNGHHQMSRD